MSYELGPMDVQVFGDVAVAQGSVTEKRIRDGKDDSGEGVWTDLLKKRAGKWVVVRSVSRDREVRELEERDQTFPGSPGLLYIEIQIRDRRGR